MRGKAFWGIHVVIRQGITPAYAGKSECIDAMTETQGDHPRLCGEKFSIRSTKSNCPGSPPPMRGKATALWAFSPLLGSPPPMRGKGIP